MNWHRRSAELEHFLIRLAAWEAGLQSCDSSFATRYSSTIDNFRLADHPGVSPWLAWPGDRTPLRSRSASTGGENSLWRGPRKRYDARTRSPNRNPRLNIREPSIN